MHNKNKLFGKIICLLGVWLGGCIEPYDLPESAAGQDFLVVDGGVNIEEGLGQVVLARTQNLADKGQPTFENGAQVTVETEQNQSFRLSERQQGLYLATGLPLTFGQKYRLRVRTRTGQEYLSAFVSTQRTPEIDSVTWHVEREGVVGKVNTHDPENDTRYYRWEYSETFEYVSGAYSNYQYLNGTIQPRPFEENIYICYRTDPSRRILTESTVRLSEDVVRDFPLTFHLGWSPQMGRKYSILVKQSAISKEEFAYWQMLKKNTENVGTLFDAQPSQVTGNLLNTQNPEEPVIGYFSARSVQEKRRFITSTELFARGLRYVPPRCQVDSVDVGEVKNLIGGNLLIDGIIDGMGNIIGYTMATASCADCRFRGGTTTKPDFWN
ncbi:hypothetical protein BH24BAC1_BH24BAC1_37260 [soil metagenome]